MKIRDLIALPFLFLSLLCESIAVRIGGKFTAEMIKNSYGDFNN